MVLETIKQKGLQQNLIIWNYSFMKTESVFKKD